ncbi:MAG: hypothetical protein GF404_08335 [candidate division Zixibacteria bacterium]|nr:hypothetical protein [candidate division Zixibacteria bacterium]
MQIKNFQAGSMQEAMQQVKKELGTDAVILNTRVFEDKGIPGSRPIKRFEITAGRDVPLKSRTKAEEDKKAHRLTSEDRRLLSDVGLVIRRFEKDISYLIESQKEIKTLLQAPTEAKPVCSYLSRQDLEQDLIARLFAEATEEEQRNYIRNLELLRVKLLSMCEKPQPVRMFATGCHKVAFIGPPGCGKSSLLAKVGARLVFQQNVKTTLVNLDDYKPTASQDMEIYARLLKVQHIEEADWLDPDEEEEKEFNVVLADTKGLPFGSNKDLDKMITKLDLFNPDEIHLVLPAYSRWSEVVNWLDFYEPLGPTQVAITFLDQTQSYGLPFNIAAYLKMKLSYFGWGRNLSSDLQIASLTQLSAKLFENLEDHNAELS